MRSCCSLLLSLLVAPLWVANACAEPIHEAAKSGDVAQLREILEARPDSIAARDSDGNTALHVAALFGKAQIVERLVAAGADLKATGALKFSVIHWAAIGVDFHQLGAQFLASVDASSRARFLDGARNALEGRSSQVSGPDHALIVRAMREARFPPEVQAGKRQIIRVLADRTSIEARNAFGQTPLHIASLTGVNDLAEELLMRGADVGATTQDGSTPLHLSVSSESIETTRTLLRHGANPNIGDSTGASPLHRVLSGEMAALLIEYKADVNIRTVDGWTPLNVAAAGNGADVVSVLLKSGADPSLADYKGYSPLQTAAEHGSYEVARILLAAGVPVNIMSVPDKRTPLHMAAQNDRKTVVELLIQNGADVDVDNQFGRTALHDAIVNGASGAVDVLLDAKADPNRWAHGMPPLHLVGWSAILYEEMQASRRLPPNAIVRKKTERAIVASLLSHGAQLNGKDQKEATPLIWAARAGLTDVVDLLIKSGADVNAHDLDGRTALHVAVLRGDRRCVGALLGAGADRNARMFNGLTPLGIAERSGLPEMAAFLREAGAPAR